MVTRKEIREHIRKNQPLTVVRGGIKQKLNVITLQSLLDNKDLADLWGVTGD